MVVGLCLQSKVHISTLRAHVPGTGANALRLEMEPQAGMSLTFESFLLAGAVPPYSTFLLDVLRYYGIRLAHLTPNSLVILSVFAYLCEQFLGVPPSLDLFRSYYICRGNSNPRTIGSCHFRPRRKQNTPMFIYVQTHVPQQWKDKWVYIEDRGGHEETAVPSEPAVSADTWQAPPCHTPHLAGLQDRVAELRRCGLTGAMVLADAIKRRLSPLRSRARLACLYAGEDDDTRTFPHDGGLSSTQLSEWMKEVLGTSGLDTLPPAEALPLCELEPSLRIQRMPMGGVLVEMELTTQATTTTSGGTRDELTTHHQQKRPLPEETAEMEDDDVLSSSPSARRRSTRLRPDGDGAGEPQTTTSPPHSATTTTTTLGPNVVEAGESGSLAPPPPVIIDDGGRLSPRSRLPDSTQTMVVASPLLAAYSEEHHHHHLPPSSMGAITDLSRENDEMKRELEKVKRDLEKAIAEKDQCRDTYNRARAALRQLDLDPGELRHADDDDDDDSDSCALFGRVVDRLELIVHTMPDRWLEGAREVAQGTTELVLGHCLRLHPQVDLQVVVKAAMEEELPIPETDEAQALHDWVLEGARRIVHQRVQVQAPAGDGEDDTSTEEWDGDRGGGGAGTGGSPGSSAAAQE